MVVQPISPWAERFIEALKDPGRPFSILKQDVEEHSGLAAEFPRKDPKFHDNLEKKRRMPKGVEFDRLFLSEQYQEHNHFGNPTWKLTSLNHYLWASNEFGIMPSRMELDDPGRIQQEYKKRRIEVDETTWFSFFQKPRWYNLTDHPRRPTQPAAKGGPWTVDEPVVWENLRVSIELANRMLKSLIIDRHYALETITFGRLVYWKNIPSQAANRPFEDAMVLLSSEMEVKVAAREFTPLWQSEFSKLPEEHKTRALEQKLEELSKDVIWSFLPHEDPGTLGGWTYVSTGTPVCTVNVNMLRHLCENDVTMSERLMLQFQITTTIIHELMHAIMWTRYCNEGATIESWPLEPFFDFDAVAEMGEAMEARLWGGKFGTVPSANAIPITTGLFHWPSPFAEGGIRDLRQFAFQDGSPMVVESFPPLYIAKLFSSEFWDSPLPLKKSDAQFSRINIFRSIAVYYRRAPVVWNGINVDESHKAQWDGLDQAIVQALWDRQDEVKSYRRGWYDDHVRRWATTPWGMNLHFRQFFDNFVRSFQDRDEFSCDYASSALIYGGGGLVDMNWSNPYEFSSKMPATGSSDHTWIHFTIGLLMLAVMPVRTLQFPEKSPFRLTWPKEEKFDAVVTFIESSEAWMARKSRARPQGNTMIHFTRPKSDNRTRQANVLHNPFQNGSAVPDPTQLKYLDLVDKILETIIQVQAIVSGPWYREIERVSQDLREQRKNLIFKYPLRHTIRWATSWEFRVPDYDPEDLGLMQWDEVNKTWRHFATAPLPPPPPSSSASSLSSPVTPTSPPAPPISNMHLKPPSSSAPLLTPPSSHSQ